MKTIRVLRIKEISNGFVVTVDRNGVMIDHEEFFPTRDLALLYMMDEVTKELSWQRENQEQISQGAV